VVLSGGMTANWPVCVCVCVLYMLVHNKIAYLICNCSVCPRYSRTGNANHGSVVGEKLDFSSCHIRAPISAW